MNNTRRTEKAIEIMKDILVYIEANEIDETSIEDLKNLCNIYMSQIQNILFYLLLFSMSSSIFIILLSFSYMTISLSTTILNKYILTILEMETPFLLVVYQSVIICSILIVTNIQFKNISKWIIPSIFLSIMIFSGSKSLQYLDISLYTLIKNSSIFIVAILEYLIFNRLINLYEGVSFILMILSSYYSVFTINLYGIIWISLNVISTTAYIMILKHVLKNLKGTINESIFFPNLVSIFLIGPLSLIFESTRYQYLPINTIIIIVISSMSALLTALSTAKVLKYLSSTTYSMLGAMNKILLGFTGFIFIREDITKIKIYSLLLGTTSTVLYTYSQQFKKKCTQLNRVKL